MARLVIDKGVPVPDGVPGGKGNIKSLLRVDIEAMQVGDSFVTYGAMERRKIRSIIAELKRYQPEKRFTMRMDTEPGFSRCWRVK